MRSRSGTKSEETKAESNNGGNPFGDYSEALAKAFVPSKGQKLLIRKLYSDCDQVIAECSVEELLEVIHRPAFLASIEGRKLVAAFASKIGIATLWRNIEGIILKSHTTSEVCERYGEVLLWIWKKAVDDKAMVELENCLIDAAYHSLCSEPSIAKKFAALMRPMRKGTNTEVDNMVFRIMRPNLWRCLKARNAKVRLNAIILLAMFYPILTDDFENEEYLERQREAFRELLFDDSYAVRIVACKSALSILASFWITFDNGYIEELLTKVVDNLSKDSIVPVRVAVFESLQFLLSCPQAVNALQRALKCLVPRGINDNNERVRLAAFELLTMLGKHRFIRFWNVVNMKLILQCFEVEESESVRKQITRLLFPSFMSMAVDADETIRRIIFMGAITRNGALSFHHLIVTMKLITVEQALEHVQMLAIVLCKLLRPLSSPNASSRSTGDSKIPMPSSASATPVIVDADEKDESEGAQQWRSCTLLLECLVVMWMALRKRIQGDSLKIERTRTTNILSKLFRMLFIGFKNSSIIESIMALGSTLSEQADVSVVVLRELLSSEPIDESRLSCYLEVASSWRFSCVLDYVHSGLHAVASLTNGSRISIKQAKKRNCSQKCSLSRALRYLEVVLKSPTMQQNLIANHYTQMEMFHTALLPLNNIIERKLDDASRNVFNDRCQQISDGVILRAYEIRHTLSIIILNTLEDEEKRRQMEELLEEDAAWIVNTLMVKLVSHEEPDEALFLVHFCQDALRLFSYHLGTYPHSTRFKRIVAGSIVVLASKETPAVFITSVLKTLKNLCRAAGGLDDEELVLETIVPLTRSCLLWMSERIDDDDFDVKGCSEAFLSLVGVLKEQRRLSQNALLEYAKCIISAIFPVLMQINENELDIVSPQGQGFIVPRLVELLLQRIAMKSPLIRSATMDVLLSMIKSKALVDRYDDRDIFHAYYAVAQLVLLSTPRKGQSGGAMTLGMKRYKSQRAACVEAICKGVEELDDPIKTRQFRDRMMLCR